MSFHLEAASGPIRKVTKRPVGSALMVQSLTQGGQLGLAHLRAHFQTCRLDAPPGEETTKDAVEVDFAPPRTAP